MKITAWGPQLALVLADLDQKRYRVLSISRGRSNAQWIIHASAPREVQGLLDLARSAMAPTPVG